MHYKLDLDETIQSADGKIQAIFEKDRVFFRDTTKNQLVGREIQIPGQILDAALSPKGDMLATAHEFWIVKIWNVANGEMIEFKWFERPYTVAFGPYGKVLAAGYYNGEVIQWNPVTRKQIGPPLKHEAQVWAVAYSPDGKILATASGKDPNNTSLQLWDMSAGSPYYGLKLPLNKKVHGKTALDQFGKTGEIFVGKTGENRMLGWRFPAFTNDLRQMQLCTWVALASRRNTNGGISAIPWEQHHKLRQELDLLQDIGK
jgi:WD40 repeat protein